MRVYRSKVDIWTVALVCTPFAVIIALDRQEMYEALYVIIPIILFVFSLYWQIKYIIADEHLMVKAGLFGSEKVAVSQIKSVEKTYNPLSAPALSLKRLEVKYGKYDYVLISPDNTEKFIEELKALNPNIDIKI